jgi:hypothetical protein
MIINEDNILKLHGNLLNIPLSYCCKHVHILKMAVFWVVAPCSLVEILMALIMEAARTS